jgi:hypothetical protein
MAQCPTPGQAMLPSYDLETKVRFPQEQISIPLGEQAVLLADSVTASLQGDSGRAFLPRA